jgi:LysR family cys regulon transcriptional activator
VNFQQLRIVREAVRQRFHLTDVANALYTSQSGVSKHLIDLEDELGVQLFVRRGKRLTGLTEPGRELVPMVERVLLELANIKRLADHFALRDEGTLRIATTHTQARYALPPIVAQFKAAFPRVNLQLHQGTPSEIACLLAEDEVDLGIATESLADEEQFACFPFYRWHHAVLVPEAHPLTRAGRVTLEQLAQFPLVTYHRGFTGRGRIDAAFESAGLSPQVALEALDSDVLKAYVELGLGVGLVAQPAFKADRDRGLVVLPAEHLFGENITLVAVLRNRFLRSYAVDFLKRCCPDADVTGMVPPAARLATA